MHLPLFKFSLFIHPLQICLASKNLEKSTYSLCYTSNKLH